MEAREFPICGIGPGKSKFVGNVNIGITFSILLCGCEIIHSEVIIEFQKLIWTRVPHRTNINSTDMKKPPVLLLYLSIPQEIPFTP